jgi:hypothetical protein
LGDWSQPVLNLNDALEHDQSHDYYYQIQGQLFCSGRKEYILMVYTLKDMKTINLHRNDSFIEVMLQKLEEISTAISRNLC